jgi:hypothetical protein
MIEEDAARGRLGSEPSPAEHEALRQSILAQDAPSMLRIPATCNPPGLMIGTEIRLGDALTRRR